MGTCNSTSIQAQDTWTSQPSFKIIIVGDPRVGKSAVFDRYVRNQFTEQYSKTKNVRIVDVTKMVNVPLHMVVSLNLWDVPGTDDIDLTSTYFKNLDAAIVVVDTTSEKSLEMAGYWRQYIINGLTSHNGMTTSDAYKLPVLLLANKYDKVDKRQPDIMSKLEHFKDDLKENDNLDNFRLNSEEDAWQPECVKQVKKVAEAHRFISGVLVSAKEPDSSIHLAMQTLIRHMIERCMADQMQLKGNSSRRRQAKKLLDESALNDNCLRTTGIESVDKFISQSEELIQRIYELKVSYEQTLDKFKLACADAEIIPAGNYNKASIEQCITAIKIHVGDSDQLQVDEMHDGMIKLYVIGDDQPRGELATAMDKFNKSFAAVCIIIMSEYGSLKSSVKLTDYKILQSESEIWETQRESLQTVDEAGGMGNVTVDYKEVSNIIKENRIKIGESLLLLEEINNHASKAKDKVKASLSW